MLMLKQNFPSSSKTKCQRTKWKGSKTRHTDWQTEGHTASLYSSHLARSLSPSYSSSSQSNETTHQILWHFSSTKGRTALDGWESTERPSNSLNSKAGYDATARVATATPTTIQEMKRCHAEDGNYPFCNPQGRGNWQHVHQTHEQ